MVVDPIPKLRFVLCAIRDTNEHIGQLILLQLRTPLCKISSTGEIEQRFRLN